MQHSQVVVTSLWWPVPSLYINQTGQYIKDMNNLCQAFTITKI